jgi:cytochrome c-type biogenesis protein CcmH
MTLWVVLSVLSLAAIGFITWPLYRKSKQLTALLGVVIVATVGLSAGLYYYIGSPGVPSGAGATADLSDVVGPLEQRLTESPEDIDGWILLGRSYQTMQRYDDAITAFETAIELERGQNAQTLAALAIVLMEQNGGELTQRSGSLFENALSLEPANANALFYGGAAAAQRGNTALAADRWEMLLQQNAPPEIQELLQKKIAEWRGQPPPNVAAAPVNDGLSISLSLSAAAMAELPADARVFVIARDPAQPSPPIAVIPLRLAQLPVRVSLGDRNAMMEGRMLSGFAEYEVLVRVSLSGQPMAQSGDWYGSQIVTAGTESIELVIDQKTP